MAMAGSWTATSASSQIVPANYYRDKLVIQMRTGSNCYLDWDGVAVVGVGVQLVTSGSVIIVTGPLAQLAVNAIAAGGATGGYQEALGVCD